MNLPRVYMCSPSWTPSHLPPHTILLGHPSAPALSIQYHASNLDWRFISHMIIYMFQCHSAKSSHPRPLPQSPKDCSIHLCLFCCLAYRIIVTIFAWNVPLVCLSYLSLLFFRTLHSDGYIFPFLLCFSFSSFLSYLEGLLRQPFCLFACLFLGDGLNYCLLYNVTNLCL